MLYIINTAPLAAENFAALTECSLSFGSRVLQLIPGRRHIVTTGTCDSMEQYQGEGGTCRLVLGINCGIRE